VAAAKAIGYTNAGTVEFIVAPDNSFYFLEVNTRLQVEHPITELVTGVDLVRWQLLVSQGEALPLSQEQLSQRGHAIECRIYAEDPATGFLPATGTLHHVQWPQGPTIRVDAGVETGSEVGIHYDPMLAKLIVWGETRAVALKTMDRALQETILLGVTILHIELELSLHQLQLKHSLLLHLLHLHLNRIMRKGGTIGTIDSKGFLNSLGEFNPRLMSQLVVSSALALNQGDYPVPLLGDPTHPPVKC
jgi:acetyl/propionyl-CoA carboxylase alpha subunit